MKGIHIVSTALMFFLLKNPIFCEDSKSTSENDFGKNFLLSSCDEKKCCPKNYPQDYQTLQSAKGCREKKCGPYIDIAGLIWQSKEGSLEYASKAKILNSSKINSSQKQFIVVPDFAWRPGIKIDVGYVFDNDNWDIKALWTYYRGEFTHVKKHTNVEIEPADNGVIPLFVFFPFRDWVSPSLRYKHSTGDWTMYFNTIDLEIARNSFVRRKFSIRLLFGFKGARINQHFKIEYIDGNRTTGPLDDITHLNCHLNIINNFWGFGPRVGFESKCHLIWGFKLLANGSVSAMLSNFHIKRSRNYAIFNENLKQFQNLPIKYRNDFFAAKPTIGLLLGIEWSRCFRQTFLALSLGYEMQYFWDQNQAIRPTDISQSYSSRGDLQLHGLTANLKYEF